ncbi:hypothetical protein PVK06_047175 [Gossypium arboreum]|uniref:Aminotransferase-like plant mobile domain-containing protein n=1 Tax=Gossypium arboreum TaxID=29729 RepID=A0ABR0MCP3_GOSAR|nr:hypothetical protein PVK06_047175 [Gossypium arboreum]
MPYLELAGFGSAALIRTFDLQYDLISVLVERWRPETHTFHLPCGECTVILEDVVLQLGLSITGSAVMSVSTIAELAALCYSLLGASLGDDESNFLGLKFTWLKDNFEHLAINATEEELMCVAQAYIMHIIGGVSMLDVNNNRVHLQYLPLLADLRNVRSRVVPWGSSTMTVWLHPVYPTSANASGEDSRHQQMRKTWKSLGVVHQKYIMVWDNQMARRPQMDISSDFQLSLEYIQWYSSMRKPYLLGGQLTVIPPHVQRPGTYELALDIEAEPKPKSELEP